MTTTAPKPPEAPEPRTAANPVCYACRQEILDPVVTWLSRNGKLEPHCPSCAHPTPRVHGVVVK